MIGSFLVNAWVDNKIQKPQASSPGSGWGRWPGGVLYFQETVRWSYIINQHSDPDINQEFYTRTDMLSGIDEPVVCQEDTRELVVHDRNANGHVVCSDVIDEPMFCQEDTRRLVVHDSVLVDASCAKAVQYLWWPVASASLFSFPPWMKPFIIKLGGV